METFSVRMIRPFANEYRGYINLEDETFYGIATEMNYDTKVKLDGYLAENGLYLVISSTQWESDIRIEGKINYDYFPKKTLIPSLLFSANALDRKDENWYIELTNIKDISSNLEIEEGKKLDKKSNK